MHISHPSFGLEIPEDSLLVKVLKEVKKTNAISSKALLHQAYENSQGIHDYIAQEIYERSITDPDLKRPLSSVALHSNESICEGSGLYDLIKMYAEKKIHTFYGLSLIEYLELPHDVCQMIMLDCNTRLQKEYNTTSDVLDSLNNTKK